MLWQAVREGFWARSLKPCESLRRPRAAGGELPRTVVAVDGGVFVRHADYRAEVLAGVRDILGDAVADRFSLKVQET